MGKAYWVAAYRSVSNPEALAAYAKLAGPAIIASGGRILARGVPALVDRGRAPGAHGPDRVRFRGTGQGGA